MIYHYYSNNFVFNEIYVFLKVIAISVKRANQRMQVRGNQLSVINFSGWVRYQCWLWSFHPTVQVTAFFRFEEGVARLHSSQLQYSIKLLLLYPPTVSRLNIFLILRTILFFNQCRQEFSFL